jgi:hypothetical protein
MPTPPKLEHQAAAILLCLPGLVCAAGSQDTQAPKKSVKSAKHALQIGEASLLRTYAKKPPGRAAISRQTGEARLDRQRNNVLSGTATQPDFLLPALALGAHRPGRWAHSSEPGRSRDKLVVT